MRKLVLLLLLAFASPAYASDPVGIYALIDRVVFEPDSGNPARIQLWGVFALSDGKSGDNYRAPERGYLYYSLNTSNERAVRAEWSDLRASAGTGQPVGFAGRYKELGRVRRAGETPATPDIYPLGYGLVKVLAEHLGPTIERDLRRVPSPHAPADGSRVAPGPVTLVAKNAGAGVQYVFEIENASAGRETSQPIAAGRTETTWSPRMQIRRGESYTWRVWTVEGTAKGAAATATFSGAQ